jgi:galactose oxidase
MCAPGRKATACAAVFHAGPSPAMHWFTTSGDGSVRAAGTRPGGDQMNGNAVMYAAGKILTSGGAPAYDARKATSLAAGAATAAASIITLSGNSASVAAASPMKRARSFANSVVLPDGKVVVMGGMPSPVPFSDKNAVLVPGTFPSRCW